jgi:tRNA:m4X modification enzyme
MSKIVGWAVCGSGMSRERRKQIIGDESKLAVPNLPKLKLNVEKRKVIGDKCKRVMDFARVKYLEANNFECKLNFYCEQDITLENVVLVAKLKNA